MSRKTVLAQLVLLGVTRDDVTDCGSTEDELKVIKRCYFKACLKHHPDKGGDAALFRAANEAWESIVDLFEKGKVCGGRGGG